MLKHNKYLYILMGLVSFGYVLIRSILLDITYDEAWTLDGFVGIPLMNIINYTPPIANNHIINTLLIKLFYLFGNESVFIARLPNVIASVFYLYFTYRISIEFFKLNIGVALFILLVSNPFILDFFSLARGYGLALAFIMASLYYLLRFIENHKIYEANISMILGALSVLSSFSVLYYLLSLIFVIYFSYFLHKGSKAQFIKLIKGTFIIAITIAAILYEPLRKLIKSGELWYGGNENFYESTLVSLVSYSLGNKFDRDIVLLVLNSFITIFTLFITASLFNGNDRVRFWSGKKWILTVLVVIPIVATILSHHLFGTKYLIDRTAIFFYPLIVLTFVIFANEIRIKVVRFIAVLLVAVFSLLSITNFVNYWNFYTTITWFQDSHTHEIMKNLNDFGRDQNKTVKLDADWPFRASILYYQKRKYFEYVEFVEDEPENLDSSKADFYLHLSKSLYNVGYYAHHSPIPKYKRDTSMFFEQEGILLLSNLEKQITPTKNKHH